MTASSRSDPRPAPRPAPHPGAGPTEPDDPAERSGLAEHSGPPALPDVALRLRAAQSLPAEDRAAELTAIHAELTAVLHRAAD